MTDLTDLIARWNTDEGKPYKGSLIDMISYESAPGDIDCMCAQGQVLHLIGGWDAHRLNTESQAVADAETAKLLNISRAHAVLLRTVNDKTDGAPAVVLTNPGKVLGDQWSKLLDFWWHLDGLTHAHLYAAWDAAGAAAWDAAGAAAWDAARAAAWDAAWDAARDAAGAAAGAAACASSEIQGAEILHTKGKPLFFLPAFGFEDTASIPSRPADYGNPA